MTGDRRLSESTFVYRFANSTGCRVVMHTAAVHMRVAAGLGLGLGLGLGQAPAVPWRSSASEI